MKRQNTGEKAGFTVTLLTVTVLLFLALVAVTGVSPEDKIDFNGEYIKVETEDSILVGTQYTVTRKSDEVHEVVLIDGGEVEESHDYHPVENVVTLRQRFDQTVVALSENGTELERVEPDRGESE